LSQLERSLQLDQLAGALSAGSAHPADKDAGAGGISLVVFAVPNDRSFSASLNEGSFGLGGILVS